MIDIPLFRQFLCAIGWHCEHPRGHRAASRCCWCPWRPKSRAKRQAHGPNRDGDAQWVQHA